MRAPSGLPLRERKSSSSVSTSNVCAGVIALSGTPIVASLLAKSQLLDHARPQRALHLDVSAELLGSACHRLRSERHQPFLDLRLGHDLRDLLLKTIDDGARRSR